MGTKEDEPAGTLELPEGRITKDRNEKHSKRKLRSKVAVSLHSVSTWLCYGPQSLNQKFMKAFSPCD